MLALALPVSYAQDEETPSGSFENRLSELWSTYLGAKVTGDNDARDKALDAIKDLQPADSGNLIFEQAALLFLEEGYQDLRLGRLESARREFLNAADLNPHLWPAFSGLADIKRKTEGIEPYLRLRYKGIARAFQLDNAFFVLDALVWFIRNIFWFLTISFVLFAAFLCAKYVRAFYHTTVGSFEEKGMEALYANLMAVAILLLPLLLGANAFLVAAIYIVLFIPFFEPNERLAAYLLFIFPILIPFLGLFLANVNQARSNPLLRAHLGQYFDGDLDSRIQFLRDNVQHGELGNLSLFTIGRLQSQKGEWADALETYELIPDNSKYKPLSLVNQGNIHLRRKEYQNAADTYGAALQKDPEYALATYNLSVALRRQGKLQEAEKLRADAFNKDLSLRERQIHSPDEYEASADSNERLFYALSGETNAFSSSWLTHPIVFVPVVVCVAILVLAILHLRLRNPHLLAKACTKCGRIFFQSDSPESEWCSQCVNLYIRKEDLPSEAKIRKHEEVTRFNKNNRLIAGIGQVLVPGSKKVFTGHALAGLVIVCVWVFLLVFCFIPVNAISYPYMTYLQGPALTTMLVGAVTVVYWVIFGLRPIWQED
ncbi:MAG: tetratricopeptide repeat protein [Acidobacteriota bacterium]|nr:tetratricopeptide repeat protein [Acidobacteriota bacterium]